MSEITWLTDANGNRCSVQYFGSREAAQKALDSLNGCRDCTNCLDCSCCSDCSDCLDCSYCSGCSDCLDCSYCSDCSDCSRCSDCSYCSYCSCCSYCSYCSGCSYRSGLRDVKGVKATPIEPVPVPVIENIHQRLAEVVTKDPAALEMETWHTCEKKHCRGGWIVTMAGEAGRKLEAFHNTELAAALIYHASSPKLPVPMGRFYDSNEDALADIERMAELEAAQTEGGKL